MARSLLDALFGSAGALSPWEIVLGLGAPVAVILFVIRFRNALIVSMISPEIALTSQIDVARIDYFLLAFALTIGLGLRYLGVLLMGSLLIIPPAIARRFARDLDGMFTIAIATAVISTVSGICIGVLTGRQSGPLIVMIAGGFFFLSLPLRGRA